MEKELSLEVVVEYSKKHIDKVILAELVYSIIKENIGIGVGTNEKENSCA